MGHLASAYYADIVNPAFEAPTVPHLALDNFGNPDPLRPAQIELFATADNTAENYL